MRGDLGSDVVQIYIVSIGVSLLSITTIQKRFYIRNGAGRSAYGQHDEVIIAVPGGSK